MEKHFCLRLQSPAQTPSNASVNFLSALGQALNASMFDLNARRQPKRGGFLVQPPATQYCTKEKRIIGRARLQRPCSIRNPWLVPERGHSERVMRMRSIGLEIPLPNETGTSHSERIEH